MTTTGEGVETEEGEGEATSSDSSNVTTTTTGTGTETGMTIDATEGKLACYHLQSIFVTSVSIFL